MEKKSLTFIICLGLLLDWSCNHKGSIKDLQEAENRILQQEDGTLSLQLEKTVCYSDELNPSYNTADWNIVISKPGRFKVWLSSATKDTNDLTYVNSVRINLLDDHIVANPTCDKIGYNSGDVPFSYYKTESYMGSLYVSEPGEYNMQVISEKVIAKNNGAKNYSPTDSPIMMSLILTPITY